MPEATIKPTYTPPANDCPICEVREPLVSAWYQDPQGRGEVLCWACPICSYRRPIPFVGEDTSPAPDPDTDLFAAVVETPEERDARWHAEWEASRPEREAWAATGKCSTCGGSGRMWPGECCSSCFGTGLAAGLAIDRAAARELEASND